MRNPVALTMLLVVCFLSAQPVADAAEALMPQGLRKEFIEAYQGLDTERCDEIVARLKENSPQSPVTSELQFQLGKLYAYVVGAEDKHLYAAEYKKANDLLKDFLPEGSMGQSAEASLGQIEYACLKARTGEKVLAYSLYRKLAEDPNPGVVQMALLDAEHFIHIPETDLTWWAEKASVALATPLAQEAAAAFEEMRAKRDELIARSNNAEPKLPSLRRQVLELHRDVCYPTNLPQEEKRAGWQKIVDMAREYRAALNAEKNKGLRTEDAESELRVLFCHAISAGYLQLREECIDNFEQIVERQKELPEDRRAILGTVYLWQAAGYQAEPENLDPETAKLKALTTGYCGPFLFKTTAKDLAQIVARRDVNEGRRILRDLQQFSHYPALCLQAKYDLEEFLRTHPELPAEDDGEPSILFEAMLSAGLVHKAGGRIVFASPTPYDAPDLRIPGFDWAEVQ